MKTHLKAATKFAPKSLQTQITTTLQRHSINKNLQEDLKAQKNKPISALSNSDSLSHSLRKISLSSNRIARNNLNIHNRSIQSNFKNSLNSSINKINPITQKSLIIQRRRKNNNHLSSNIKGQIIITNRTNKTVTYIIYRSRQKQNLVPIKLSLPSNRQHRFLGKYSFTNKDMAGKGKVPIYYDGLLSWWSASRGILYLSFEFTKGAARHPVLGLDSKSKKASQQKIKKNAPTQLKYNQGNFNDFSQKISQYFTVGEVTKNSTKRIPKQEYIKNNIVELAKKLDEVRQWWGSGLIVTSWYRPPKINKAVGGVSNSQHLYGKGVDIRPQNGKVGELQNRFNKEWYLSGKWQGGFGTGAERGFIHLDTGGKRKWKY